MSEVEISQGVGVSLKKSYSEQTTRAGSGMKTHYDTKEHVCDFYLQRVQRWGAGPRLMAGRRRGVPNSSHTGLPARHTHTAQQSSETQQWERSKEKFNKKESDMKSRVKNDNSDNLPDENAFTACDHSESTH